jgi:putative phage-type endonuclease
MSRNIVLDKVLRVHGQQLKQCTNAAEKTKCLAAITSDFKNQSAYPITNECIQKRVKVVSKYQEQLELLKLHPVIEQRTPPWYKVREKMITASRFGSACGVDKNSSYKEFMRKACKLEEDPGFPAMLLEIMEWGTMMEEVATQIYMKRYNTFVNEFGLIIWDKDPRYGASPDGITDEGIMLEIKCPWKRPITGAVPSGYFYQIQGQLAICNLEECDFAEYNFQKYWSRDAFYSDWDETGRYTANWKDKGIVMVYKTSTVVDEKGKMKNQFLYSPLEQNGEEFDNWENGTFVKLLNDTDVDKDSIKPIYWHLEKVSVVRVYRDHKHCDDMFKMMDKIWDKINLYKSRPTMYEHDIGYGKTPDKRPCVEMDLTVLPSEPCDVFAGDFATEVDGVTTSKDKVNYKNVPELGVRQPSARKKKTDEPEKPKQFVSKANTGFMFVNSDDENMGESEQPKVKTKPKVKAKPRTTVAKKKPNLMFIDSDSD